MWTIQRDGHFEFNTGVFRAKLATSDFDTSHIDVDGGALQFDVSASSADIFSTAGRVLALDGADGVVVNGAGPVTISSQSASDLTLSADGDLVLSAASSVTVGLTSGSLVGFYGDSGTAKPTITGSRDSNVALGELLSALHLMGLITNSTTT